MLEFWASWCGPCRGEIPHLRHVYQEYKDKGFEIISISIDEKKTDWDKAMKEEKMVWKQLCDPNGFNGPVAQKYNITGVPTCILLDKEGRIFKTECGEPPWMLFYRNYTDFTYSPGHRCCRGETSVTINKNKPLLYR